MRTEAYICLVYVFISTQTGCVLNDSMLTQVEGYSRMRNGERQPETGEEREIERRAAG